MILNGSAADVPDGSGRLWHFAGREFDESRLELRVGGTPVELELKPLEVLLQLLLRAGEVVSKEDLLDAVWPGLSVVDGSLATAIYKLRKALGDEDSAIVLTVPRVGYRLGASARSELARALPFRTELAFQAGSSIPGREHWRLSRPLDASASSEVWLAEHSKTHEPRVFKFVSTAARLKSLKREVTVFRFLRESLGERADFVRVLEWNFGTQPYFVESEYGGPNLAEWAESQGGLSKVPLEKRLRMLAGIAQTVADAHRAGVLHRDLKPANILVTPPALEGDGQIKVADFGSASLLEPSRLQAMGITNLGLTRTGDARSSSLTGTLMYLAPEVLCGHSPTASSDVYALGVMLYQSVISDFRKPLAPGWEAGVEDRLLQEDIACAVHGDPAQRLASAAELAERLLRIDQRRLERSRLDQAQQHQQSAKRRRAEARARRPWMVVATVALGVAILVSLSHFYRKPALPGPAPVAVIPFQNAGSDHNLDFLSLALPDEVATTLSYVRGLSMRPFATTSRYSGSNLDLQKAGREMGVGRIVTGHFLQEGNQLQVTLEAVDVESNRLLWRDTLDVPAQNLIAMQQQITTTAREGLAPILGTTSLSEAAAARPESEEAYDLYLHSIALASDIGPNGKGIAMLERAVQLDPNYPPAWRALAMRYYYEGRYGGGGEAVVQRCEAALERALALDPNFIPAGTLLTEIRVERGQLAKAYEEADDLVRRRHDSADAHFALSYVLRYAGLLDEAGDQCDLARSLDPHNAAWRSCGAVFEQNGNFKRAVDYFRLEDPHSQWSRTHLIQFLLRQGKEKEAIAVGATNIPGWESFTLLQTCAAHRPAVEIASLASAVRPQEDPELNYTFAAHLAYCGQAQAAFLLLKSSIKANHCSYPAMDKDPLFAGVRAEPEFAKIRAAGIACQKQFLTERAQVRVAP